MTPPLRARLDDGSRDGRDAACAAQIRAGDVEAFDTPYLSHHQPPHSARQDPAAKRDARRESAAPSIGNPEWEAGVVARIRAGDRDAFTELMHVYHRPLRGFVMTLVYSEPIAEELVQDLFFNIWCMRETWQIRSSLSSYLFSATQKAATNHRRRTRLFDRWDRSVATQGQSPLMGSVGPSPDERLEARELQSLLRQAILQLPPRCAQVATLRFQFEMSCPEIARAMGITVKAVERQAAKALHLLRTALGSYSTTVLESLLY